MPQRIVDPSEFADQDLTPPGPRPVDPSEFADSHPSDTVKQPWFSKAAETMGTPIASMLGFDTSKIDQPTKASSEGVRDPLTGNPLAAEAWGALRGATEAVTPAWVASALTLGKSGLLPKIASGALAAQGAGTAFDPTKSASERISGGVQGIAGLLGIKASPAAEASATAAAPKPAELVVEPTSQTARLPRIRAITPSGEPSAPPTASPLPQQQPIPYGGASAGPEPYRAAAKAGVKADLAAEAARLKAAANEDARQQIQNAIAEGGLEAKPPQISQTVSAPAELGLPAQRMTTSYAKPPESIDELLGLGEPPELKTPPAAPAPVAGPELARGEPTGPVRTQGPFSFGNVGGQVSGQPNPAEALGPPNWDDLSTPADLRVANEARSDVASGTKAAQTGQTPNAELAKFFKTPGGAAGQNYQLAKEAAAAGEIPSADAARASRLLTIPGREDEGASLLNEALTTKPVANPGEPFGYSAIQRPPEGWGAAQEAKPVSEVATPAGGPESSAPSNTGATPDWVQHQSDIVDRLTKLAKEQGGQLSPGMMQALGGITGGVVGAPIGAYEDPDNPVRGAILGAGTGGVLGAGIVPTEPGENFLNNLLNYRKLSFLSSPMVTAKKALGDVGGQAWEAARLGVGQLTGEEPGGIQAGKDLIKELPILHPVQTAKDLWTGLGDPTTGGTSMYDVAQSAKHGPLGWVGKPISAVTNAATEAMRRGGAPENTIKAITGTRLPETALGKDLQVFLSKHPYLRDYALPFTKMATNIAEGIRNVPGVASFAGDPATAKSRAIIGGLQAALGGASTLYDEAQSEAGTPTPTWQKAVRPAAMGVGGVAPFLVGQAATALATSGPARTALDLLRAMPGSQGFLPEPLPNETADNYAKRIIGQNIKTMQPTMLSSDQWSDPQAR